MINQGNDWVLSPSYDLLNVAIVNPKDTEEVALTLNGRKKKLKRAYFEVFGNNLGLNEKQISGVFNRFDKNKSLALEWIDDSFLSIEYQKKYKNILKKRYSILSE